MFARDNMARTNISDDSGKAGCRMRLKASVDYGLRIVLYLAATDALCASTELEEKLNIPRDYIIQLAGDLRREGIVEGKPGRNGGYALGRPPEKITALQIVETFDDNQHAKHDVMRRRDPDAIENHIINMHGGVVTAFCSFLDSITVADLLAIKEDPDGIYDITADALERQAAEMRSKGDSGK